MHDPGLVQKSQNIALVRSYTLTCHEELQTCGSYSEQLLQEESDVTGFQSLSHWWLWLSEHMYQCIFSFPCINTISICRVKHGRAHQSCHHCQKLLPPRPGRSGSSAVSECQQPGSSCIERGRWCSPRHLTLTYSQQFSSPHHTMATPPLLRWQETHQEIVIL